MKQTEEDLKKELEFFKKKRAEIERINNLKKSIEEEKQKIKELNPRWWERILNR